MSFSGKVAIVTGAASGMGLAITNELINQNAQVGALDVQALSEQLKKNDPNNLKFVNCDVSDESQVKKAIEQIYSKFGKLDFLVNAAGVLWIGKDVSVVETDVDIWNKVMNINLRGMANTVKFSTPLMKKDGGGSMVHFSTVQCMRGDDRPQDAYQASKAGMIALSKSIAVQFGKYGIRSNTILPWQIETPMQVRWKSNPELKKKTIKGIPLGRVGTVEDMVHACLFLLSEKASFITGTELVVDGGYLANIP